MKKLILIDGNSILNRAFYGIMSTNMLKTPDGTYTNAVYGFLSILFKIEEDLKPDYIAVAFDLKAPTKRHILYDKYKANRKGMPNELASQMPIIKEILLAMNITIVEKAGYEADDIIGTLSKTGEKNNLDVTILSGDRDNFQLVSDNITVRIPRTKLKKTEIEDFTVQKVFETYGITPIELIQVKGLMGDASDNIPGVPGIGEKTALELIKKYHSIDELYNNIEELTGKTKEKLIENKELAYLSKELGTIDINADIEKDISKFEKKEWNKEQVLELFKKYKFNRYIERFNLEGVSKTTTLENVPQKTTTDTKMLIAKIKNQNKLFYYLDTEELTTKELPINSRITGISVFIEEDNVVYYTTQISDFKEVFEDNNILKIGYKLKQDYILLKQIGIASNNLMFDVQIAGYILNSTVNQYTINSLCEEYLNIDITNNFEEKKEQQTSLFDMQIATKEPNKSNSIYSYYINKLYYELIKKLEQINQLNLFNEIEMPLCEVLASMQYLGIYVNKEELIKYGTELDEEIEKLTKKIYELCEMEFNINSPKQLGEVLFEKLNLPFAKKNKNGYSTDVAILEKLTKEHPVIDKILNYRQLVKLKSTYVDGLLPFINEKTNRIHSYFHQTVTATGRISSTDPNLQNIPTRMEAGKNLKKAFKPENNYIFLDADYSQVELRVLAHISNDENMINAFNNDEDIHTQVASKVFNVPMEEVTKAQRSDAKAVNFGIVYGISDFGLSEQLKISKKKAKEYIDAYLEKYSGIKSFMTNIVEKAKEDGYVETLFHRRRYVPELNSNNYIVRQFGNRVAMNTPIQGTAADIMKIAMINVYKELKNKKLKSKLILQIHDELLLEAYEEELEEVKVILKENMENAIKMKVPLKAEISEGKDWYEVK